ncbi:aromatic/alkene monooxygenase hydroxylase FAD-binding subunit MmoC [Methylococcus sp. ANG]|uniref:aromatic/alkene monooxygenase hydroxylase FAD-binding subunit MmoC n=1 Tax=unclassified Methylococcus TaxID=2618889 RepID=UPI001C5298F5|nr:FAD-binding oxidoreductase [Methylococcus sp. Mc7]QXP82964.1 2Fe-2S iron-sulfur cluster binding domain-containing protein [Methylococcus sp. Mc7]
MQRVHTITAVTEDGESLRFECRSDEDVITAALRQDIFLMSSCREGGCATCKALCTEGDYDLKGCSVQALPPEEEEDGLVLLCRTYPKTDLEVELPYTHCRISYGEVGSFEAEVVGLNWVSTNTVQFLLQKRPDECGNRGVKFEPGQFMELTIPGTDVSRAYSPANIPNPEGRLEFLIRVLPEGRFSDYLRNDARVGQVLSVKGPLGVFGLKEHGMAPRYFVAGGTGLAPVVSMVRQMREWTAPNETRIYFGVNTEPELFYIDELKSLERSMRNLTVKACVWKPGADWEGEQGSPIDLLREDLEASAVRPDIYLCGPPGMIDAACEVARSHGIPGEQVFFEKFLPSGTA